MPITKEALELAIKAVEKSIARIDTGVLIFGSLVAIGVTGETILGIRHWIKDRQLRDLRGVESQMHESEILGLQGEISGAKASANQLKGELDNATEEAKRQAEELKKQNLQTQSDLLAANQNLEEERRKRVELAASLLDRDFFDQSGAAARLVPFPPMSVIFEYVDEHEPKKMAEQINFIFESLLHWSTWRRSVNEETIEDGVSISVGMEPPSSFALAHRQRSVPRQLARNTCEKGPSEKWPRKPYEMASSTVVLTQKVEVPVRMVSRQLHCSLKLDVNQTMP